MVMSRDMNLDNMSEWYHTVVVPRTPNVIFCMHVNDVEDRKASGFLDDLPNKLHKDILLTALAAAKQRPDWKFFITQNGGNFSTSCSVMYERELLGSLSLDSFYNSKTYTSDTRMALTSPSIRREAQRKNHIASTNPKRVLRMLLKEFRPTPPERQAAVRAAQAATVAHQLIEEAITYSVDSNINPTVLYAFLQERGLWADYLHAALARGAKPDFGAEIERRSALKVVGDTLATARKTGKLIIATPVDGGYYVFDMDARRGLSAAPPVYGADSNLNDAMRTKLGMLKLSSPKTLVPNVGVRLNENGNVYALVAED